MEAVSRSASVLKSFPTLYRNIDRKVRSVSAQVSPGDIYGDKLMG